MKKYKLIIFDFYKTLFNPETGKLFDGIKEILIYLSPKIPLFLITVGNKERKNQIKKLNIDIYFKKIIYCKKKNEKIFNKLLVKNNVSPKESIIVGDNEEEEIKIAKNLGIEIIKINYKKENPYESIKRGLK